MLQRLSRELHFLLNLCCCGDGTHVRAYIPNTCLESIGGPRQNTLVLESIERLEKAARSANSLRSCARRCCRRRQFARRSCVRVAALPITNRDLTDRSRESWREPRSRIILEKDRERKRKSETEKERGTPLRREYCMMHIHEEFAEHLLCTGAELYTTRGSRLFVKYSDKLAIGRFLKCKCANLSYHKFCSEQSINSFI